MLASRSSVLFGVKTVGVPIRFEDLLSQEEETTSALWAAVGLPPVSPYGASIARNASPRDGGMVGARGGKRPLGGRRRLIVGDALSRASPEVRERAVPAACRARVKACDKDPACSLELLR